MSLVTILTCLSFWFIVLHLKGLHSDTLMVPSYTLTNATKIGATAEKHADMTKYILLLHALTDCDTASTLYVIGKAKAFKVLKQGNFSPLLGDTDQNEEVL